MRKSRVSICIPCYNAEQFIEETVQSVLRQTYTNFVLHVFDNASTDATLHIVSHIRDSRIRIHKSKRNIGMFQNMNTCLAVADSRYMKILCADDVLRADCLKRQVEILDHNPKVGLVYGASSIINARGKVLFIRRFFKTDALTAGRALIERMLSSGRNIIGEPTTVMVRSTCVKRHRLRYDPHYAHMGDIDFWIQILSVSDAYYLADPLSSFRVHGNSSTVFALKKVFPDYRRLLGAYQKRFGISRRMVWIGYIQLYLFFLLKSFFLFVVKWTENEKKINQGIRRRYI